MINYIYFFYDQLVDRGGVLLNLQIGDSFNLPVELIIGSCGIIILLEATRRAIGLPLVIIAICFLLFSYFGRYAPEIISHGGLSLNRLVGFQWLDQEAIFGIPIGVSVDFIFLFVLFGALLETAGGGKYFLDLAFAMVGKMRGGPAKAAILGSGMTGLISGSSIANTVTTGTFTIPIMNKGKVLTLDAKIDGIETIKTKLGTKEAFKVTASTTYSGDTIKSGDMEFWFSKDERRIFLRFKAKIISIVIFCKRRMFEITMSNPVVFI